jgi:hypothetical protein
MWCWGFWVFMSRAKYKPAGPPPMHKIFIPELLRLKAILVKLCGYFFDLGQSHGTSLAVPGNSRRTMPP